MRVDDGPARGVGAGAAGPPPPLMAAAAQQHLQLREAGGAPRGCVYAEMHACERCVEVGLLLL